MSANRTSVKVVRAIQASPEMVFEAFMYESRRREWMCDGARTVPRKGGLFERIGPMPQAGTSQSVKV